SSVFFLQSPRLPISTPFPYTTLFRSYPSMTTFDAPSREICVVRRIRTNTPLQAFVTLNDPVYVEIAQALARRIVKEGGKTDAERDRKSTRLNSSHGSISYAVFCLKKK